MDRRQFALCGAAALMPHRGERIRIALLGGGHGHSMAVVETVKQSAEWELAGIWEPDPATMARFAKAGVPALTRAQAIEDPSIPVIAVESWVWELADNAKAALNAGKHIHLDKPPAPTLKEFREIQELAARKQRLVQLGYMWRYNPAFQAALEAAGAGWLGNVYFVRACINTQIDAAERKKLARFPGGEMFELGGHVIDPIARLMGRPERVTPFLHHHDGRADDALKDNTLAVFEWRTAMGTVSTASMQPRAYPHRTLEIVGTQGTAVVHPILPPALQIDLSSAAGPYRAGVQKFEYPDFRQFVQDFSDLAAAVRGERKLPFTPEEDLLVQETLLRASGMAG